MRVKYFITSKKFKHFMIGFYSGSMLCCAYQHYTINQIIKLNNDIENKK